MTGAWFAPSTLRAAGPAAGGPLIGRNAAQRLARQELAEVSIWLRILRWIERLLHVTGNAVPGGWFGLIVLAVLAVLAVIVVIFWVRPTRSRSSRTGPALTDQVRTAQDCRRAAQRHAEAGDYAGAIIEGVRAIAAELEERGILPPRLGRTADELALEAASELPALAADLRIVTRLFDDVRYGDRDGTKAGYELVSRVDEQVRSARVTSAEPRPAIVSVGVPR